MKHRTVPAQQGMVWLRAGIHSYFLQPMALGGLFLMAFMALALVSVVPPIGPPVALILTPCLSFGLLAAVGEVRAQRHPGPKLLIEGLRGPAQRKRGMLYLGVVYGALMLGWAAFWLSPIDWSALAQLNSDPKAMEAYLKENAAIPLRVLITSLGNVPALGIFMHAAALVYWSRLNAFQALGTTLSVMLRNAPAFLLLALSLFLGFVAIVSLLQFVLGALGPVLVALVFAFMSATACVALGGMFQAFLDCYPLPESEPPTLL